LNLKYRGHTHLCPDRSLNPPLSVLPSRF